jgi:hypothetical protein
MHTVAITFMRKLFSKFAASSFFHTFHIQYRKNKTTGKVINKKSRNKLS